MPAVKSIPLRPPVLPSISRLTRVDWVFDQVGKSFASLFSRNSVFVGTVFFGKFLTRSPGLCSELRPDVDDFRLILSLSSHLPLDLSHSLDIPPNPSCPTINLRPMNTRTAGCENTGAFAFGIGYDKVTSAFWDSHNSGKQWKE